MTAIMYAAIKRIITSWQTYTREITPGGLFGPFQDLASERVAITYSDMLSKYIPEPGTIPNKCINMYNRLRAHAMLIFINIHVWGGIFYVLCIIHTTNAKVDSIMEITITLYFLLSNRGNSTGWPRMIFNTYYRSRGLVNEDLRDTEPSQGIVPSITNACVSKRCSKDALVRRVFLLASDVLQYIMEINTMEFVFRIKILYNSKININIWIFNFCILKFTFIVHYICISDLIRYILFYNTSILKIWTK